MINYVMRLPRLNTLIEKNPIIDSRIFTKFVRAPPDLILCNRPRLIGHALPLKSTLRHAPTIVIPRARATHLHATDLPFSPH